MEPTSHCRVHFMRQLYIDFSAVDRWCGLAETQICLGIKSLYDRSLDLKSRLKFKLGFQNPFRRFNFSNVFSDFLVDRPTANLFHLFFYLLIRK